MELKENGKAVICRVNAKIRVWKSADFKNDEQSGGAKGWKSESARS